MKLILTIHKDKPPTDARLISNADYRQGDFIGKTVIDLLPGNPIYNLLNDLCDDFWHEGSDNAGTMSTESINELRQLLGFSELKWSNIT